MLVINTTNNVIFSCSHYFALCVTEIEALSNFIVNDSI